MEKRYWIGRKRAAMGMARRATDSEARLIHYQLAGLYSVKAAQSASLPLSLPLPMPLPKAASRAGRAGLTA